MYDMGVRPVFEARGIRKSFDGIVAVRSASIELYSGEVHALVGGNAAGKSTLSNIMSGIFKPDGGEIYVNQKRVKMSSPRDAQALGIGTVHQNLALIPVFDVPSNMFLGREIYKTNWGPLSLLDAKTMRKMARDKIDDMGVNMPTLNTRIFKMSGGQRQMVACARATLFDCKVLILDEPTAALGVAETKEVQNLIRRYRDQGVAIMLISHNMEDVMNLADKITIMRLGRTVKTLKVAETTKEEIVGLITGAINPFKDEDRN